MSRDPLGPDRRTDETTSELERLQNDERWEDLLHASLRVVQSDGSPRIRCFAVIKGAGALAKLERDMDALALLHSHGALLSAADEDLRSRWYVTAFRAHYRQGDLAAAENDALLGLASASLARERTWLTAAAYGNLGLVAMRRGEWHTADRHLRTAVRMFTEVEAHAEAARYRVNVAVSAYWVGEWDSALSEADATVTLAGRAGTPLTIVRALTVRAMVLRARGARRECVRVVREARAMARAGVFRRESALLREVLGDLAFDRDRMSAAARLYRGASEMGRLDVAADDVVYEAQRKYADAVRRLGRTDDALALAEDAFRTAQRAQTVVEIGACRRVLASALADAGRMDDAREHARAAVTLLRGVRERYELFLTLRDTASFMDDPTTMLWEAYFTADALGLAREAADLRAVLLPQPSTRRRRVSVQGPTLHELQADTHRVFLTTSTPLLREIDRALRHPRCVLVEGETGTGKELIARYLHRNSTRATRPYVVAMCTEFQERSMAYSALFGHRAGAFTGATHEQAGLVAEAHGGTLFFDEVPDLPADVQGMLLRFLQEGQYRRLGETTMRSADVWIIAAANRSLKDRVGAGEFRQDLFYRLNGSVIRLPPLRERPDDVLPLARYYLAKSAVECGRELELSPRTEDILFRYQWPGNVRELEHAMERAASEAEANGYVEPVLLNPDILTGVPQSEDHRSAWRKHRDELDRDTVLVSLRAHNFNITQTAKALDISRRWLQKLVERHGLKGVFPS